jgi:hypothetical protein
VALPVFGCREVPQDQPVHLAFTQGRITLEVGRWLFSIKTNPDVRYPDVDLCGGPHKCSTVWWREVKANGQTRTAGREYQFHVRLKRD